MLQYYVQSILTLIEPSNSIICMLHRYQSDPQCAAPTYMLWQQLLQTLFHQICTGRVKGHGYDVFHGTFTCRRLYVLCNGYVKC